MVLIIVLAMRLLSENVENWLEISPLLVAEMYFGQWLARLDVLGIELEHAREQIGGVELRLQLLAVDAARLVQEARLLQRVAGLRLGAHHHLRRLEPIAALLIDRRERRPRRHVARV